MKKINKKKILILIGFVIIVLLGIKAFRDSRAENVIDIESNFKDSSGLVSDETMQIKALNEGKNGISVTLPDIVNNKKIKKYIITKKDIMNDSTNEVSNNVIENLVENEVNESANVSTNASQDTANNTSGETTNEDNIIEMNPGEKIYLTQEEKDNSEISFTIEYDTITVNQTVLYNKSLTVENDDKEIICVSGYMPFDTQIKVENTDISNIENQIKQSYQDCVIYGNYNIKLSTNDEDYNPKKYEQKLNIEFTVDENKKYNLLEVQDETIQEIKDFKADSDKIIIETDEIKTYLILENQPKEEQTNNEDEVQNDETVFSDEVLVESDDTDDSILVIDDYDSDKNYYTGLNYTENESKVNSGIYPESKLRKVTVNYYGYNYDLGKPEKQEKHNITLSATANKTDTGSVSQDWEQSDWGGWNQIYTRTDTITCTVSGLNQIREKYSDCKFSKWTAKISVPNDNFNSYFNSDLTNSANSGISVSLENSVITVTGDSFQGLNDSSDTWSFTFKVSFKDSSDWSINNISYDSLTVNSFETLITIGQENPYGTISDTETQAVISYKKCLPVDSSGNITMELIDNPFMNRPEGKGFNGWKTNNTKYSGSISTNTNDFVQTLKTNENNIKDSSGNYVIDLYPDWIEANIVFVSSSGSSSNDGRSESSPINNDWNTINSKLNSNIKTCSKASNREANIVVLMNGALNISGITGPNTAYTLTSLYNGTNYGSSSTYLNVGSNNLTLDSDLQLDYIYVSSNASYSSPSGTSDGTYLISPCIYGNMYNLRVGRGIISTNDNNCAWAQIQGGYYNRSSSEFKLVIESGKYTNVQLYRAYYSNNGRYGADTGATTSTTANGILVIGNDIDRNENNNEKLKIFNRMASRTTTSTNTPYTANNSKALTIEMVIKSGTIGVDYFNSQGTGDSSERNYAGIYVGGHGQTGYDKSDRRVIVEGGNIANIIGGLNIDESDKYKTYIYVKNGNVINITGGAGYTHTYGDRIIQVTGGCIKYSISGGSNGIAASTNTNNGQLTGNSLIYVGGDAHIGATYSIDDNGNKQISETDTSQTLYGVNAGSVCGGANGNSSYAGQTDGSYIIIDGSAVVHNNVFGGGNYGTIGSSSNNTGAEVIDLKNETSSFTTNKEYLITNSSNGGNGLKANGTSVANEAISAQSIPGDGTKWIFESANGGYYYIKNASTGSYLYMRITSSWLSTNASLELSTSNKTAFSVSGSNSKQIYYYYNGGRRGTNYYISYSNGWNASTYSTNLYFLTYEIKETEETKDAETLVNIKALGGTIKNNIYGGANRNSIYGTVDIAINNGNIEGVTYGGSNIEGNITGSVLMNISGGQLGIKSDAATHDYYSTDTLFGGGLGSSTKVNGRVLININDKSENLNIYGNIYGGSSLGTINNNVNININDIYSDTNTVSITGNVFGGGKGNDNTAALVTGNININVDGSNLPKCNAFGGSDVNGNVNGTIYVKIGENNVSTINSVYGGGNQAAIGTETKEVKVYLLSNAVVTNAFNGGKSADLLSSSESDETRQIYLQGGTAQNIYGGSDSSGTVTVSHLYIESGNAGNVYGGNNQGGTTTITYVNIKGGIIDKVYGGGEKAETTTSNISTTGGTVNYIFGGGNQAGVTTTNINTKGGNIGSAYGGSNTSGNVNESFVNTNDSDEIQTNKKFTMEIKKEVSIAQDWQKGNYTTYPTFAKLTVTIKNNTENNITKWNANITVPESVLRVNDSSADITQDNGSYNITEKNKYYGTNTIQANGSFSFTFEILTMQSVEDFGLVYSLSGKDDKGNSLSYDESRIETVYGGNNQGGVTTISHVTVNGGEVQNVYGGGNQAVTNETNVNINGKVAKNVFGGGNQAGVNTNTNVNLNGAIVGDNIYGGGNEGIVTGDTFVYVKNSDLSNSLYAGGNGATAVVYGNTNLYMHGTNSVTNSVFGGGNKAETGTEEKNSSKSSVNIVGAIIGKNVYGGANTSVVYGTTQTNIGYDTVQDSSLEKGEIQIGGNVFGGGEANESGSEVYDFSFISVTKGIDIQIDGNGYDKFAIKGSIFGSGNASSTSGESYITIKNYGTSDSPQSNISIQRANCATISNSAISLSGATDRTNEYKSEFFSLSRVDQVKLKDNSVLYLCNGANLLKELDSIADVNGIEEKGAVTIDSDTGETTKNVDNRIYMLEGKNLNIATNEQVTAYGKVQGMFFLGLFTNRMNPSTSTGFYHSGYNNGDAITNAGTFSSNSYAMAQHMTDHDTSIDGFYTNYNKDGIVKTDYIDTTPKDDVYYIWLVGEKMDVTVFEMSLTASKYATLGTYELLLQGFSDPNIKFAITGFSAGLANGISLVNPVEIPSIETDEEKANSVYGLSMRTGNIGWKNKGSTVFLTQDGGKYTGTNDYDADNSTYTPTLNFCFYHSQNITKKQGLGDVRIRLQVLTPIDDLNYKLSYIDINITLSSALYQNDFYEAAITPGQEFGLFTTTETTITNKSAFSTYYSLYIEDFSQSKYYENYKNYSRVLVSRDKNNSPYCFPVNTKLTMLDMVTNKYYYYVVTEEDVNQNKYVYNISDFTAMGSNDGKYDEKSACDNYYNAEKDLIYENFIFHINFADSSLENDIEQNTLLMELRDTENQTLLGVLGIQRDTMKYTVYNEKDATIKLSGDLNPETLYLGNTLNLNVVTNFTQTVVNSKTVYDTQYFDKKLGVKISIYDNNGNRLNSDSLFGVNFELDGKLYYPRVDGTTRICIADKVTDVLARLKLNTQNNTTLATGDYKIKIESFGSSDGIYYGLTASDKIELNVRIINSQYGLKVTTEDELKIVDKDTGFTLNGNGTFTSKIEYSSGLSNPSIAVSLYRRDYTDTYSEKYNLVDLTDYVKDYMSPTTREKEYSVSVKPTNEINHTFLLKDHLVSGTYKLVYKLYDDDTYVGEAYEYIVIK